MQRLGLYYSFLIITFLVSLCSLFGVNILASILITDYKTVIAK